VASGVVQLSSADPARVTPELVAEAAQQALGRPVHLAAGDLHAALDPRACVEQRRVPGGPAPEAVRAHLDQLRERYDADVAWRQARQVQIATAQAERRQRAAALPR
jgi:argininosuccinate lyase